MEDSLETAAITILTLWDSESLQIRTGADVSHIVEAFRLLDAALQERAIVRYEKALHL